MPFPLTHNNILEALYDEQYNTFGIIVKSDILFAKMHKYLWYNKNGIFITAEPFIDRGIRSLPWMYNYIVVEVGYREFWEDPKCPFRTNSETKLKVLPTLHKWGTQQRLEGSQLLNNDLIDMLMTEEDDESFNDVLNTV